MSKKSEQNYTELIGDVIAIDLDKLDAVALNNLAVLISSNPKACKFYADSLYLVNGKYYQVSKDIFRFELDDGRVSYHPVSLLNSNDATDSKQQASSKHKMLKSDISIYLDISVQTCVFTPCPMLVKVVICGEKNNPGAEIRHDNEVANETYHFNKAHEMRCFVLKRRNENGFIESDIAMPKITGVELTQWIDDEENPNNKILSHIFSAAFAVSKSMQTVHSKGTVHRDVKPQNIILGQEAKFIDFEKSKEVSQKKDQSIAGTVEYFSLDDFHKKSSKATDIKSLAAVLAEIFRATDCTRDKHAFRKRTSEAKSYPEREALFEQCAATPFDFTHLFRGLSKSEQVKAAQFRTQILELLFYMTQEEPSKIPDADEIVAILESFKNELANSNLLAVSDEETPDEVIAREKQFEEENRAIIERIKTTNVTNVFTLTMSVIKQINAYAKKIEKSNSAASAAINQLAKNLSALRLEFIKNPKKDQNTVDNFIKSFITPIMKQNELGKKRHSLLNLLTPISKPHLITEFNDYDLQLLKALFKKDPKETKFKAHKDGMAPFEVTINNKKVQFYLANDILRFETSVGETVYRILKPKSENYFSTTKNSSHAKFRSSDHCLRYDEGRLIKSDEKKPTEKFNIKKEIVPVSALDYAHQSARSRLENEKEIHRLGYKSGSCDEIVERTQPATEKHQKLKVYYLAKKYIEGIKLYDFFEKILPTLNTKDRLSHLKNLFETVNRWHIYRQVAHLDIKPPNILYHEGRFFLIDFEGSNIEGSDKRHPSIVPSPRFTSPEAYIYAMKYQQAVTQGDFSLLDPLERPSFAADICSLGIIAAGFFAPNTYLQQKEKVKGDTDKPNAPCHLDDILLNADSSDDHRFQLTQLIQYMTRPKSSDRMPNLNEGITFLDRIIKEMDAANYHEEVKAGSAQLNQDNVKKLETHGQLDIYEIYHRTQKMIDDIYQKAPGLSQGEAEKLKKFAKDLSDFRQEFFVEKDKDNNSVATFVVNFTSQVARQPLIDKHRHLFDVVMTNLVALLALPVLLARMAWGAYRIWGAEDKNESLFFAGKTKTRETLQEESSVLREIITPKAAG